MMKQITVAEAAGRPLKKFVGFMSYRAALVFEDNTFCLLKIDRGYDPGDEWIVPAEEGLFTNELHEAVEAGILSQEEAEAIIASEEEARLKKLEARQRADYKRLKAKFEK